MGDYACCACENRYGGNNCEENCPNDKYLLLSVVLLTGKYDGACHGCESEAWSIPASECDKCPDNSGKWFISSSPALCFPYTFPDGLRFTVAEYTICAPLRIYTNNYCVLDVCNGFRLDTGTCLPCSLEGDWQTKDKIACEG